MRRPKGTPILVHDCARPGWPLLTVTSCPVEVYDENDPLPHGWEPKLHLINPGQKVTWEGVIEGRCPNCRRWVRVEPQDPGVVRGLEVSFARSLPDRQKPEPDRPQHLNCFNLRPHVERLTAPPLLYMTQMLLGPPEDPGSRFACLNGCSIVPPAQQRYSSAKWIEAVPHPDGAKRLYVNSSDRARFVHHVTALLKALEGHRVPLQIPCWDPSGTDPQFEKWTLALRRSALEATRLDRIKKPAFQEWLKTYSGTETELETVAPLFKEWLRSRTNG